MIGGPWLAGAMIRGMAVVHSGACMAAWLVQAWLAGAASLSMRDQASFGGVKAQEEARLNGKQEATCMHECLQPLT